MFPFNWLPQRVGLTQNQTDVRASPWFPFNWLPQRVGLQYQMISTMTLPGQFPFNWLPQRVGLEIKEDLDFKFFPFPFNWLPQRVGLCLYYIKTKSSIWSFHSTDCPSEWGLLNGKLSLVSLKSFHSTDCPSEWGSCLRLNHPPSPLYTQFPFNWLPQRVGLTDNWWKSYSESSEVSIQLIAPASGASGS